LTEDNVEAFERSHEIVLPGEYRSFLLKTNGGEPQPDYFEYVDEGSGEVAWGRVDFFFAIHTAPAEWSRMSRNTDLAAQWARYKAASNPRMPIEMMPIADTSSSKLCLCVSGNKVGQVFDWDHENELGVSLTELEGAPGSLWQNCHLIASSFNEFLDSFCERPDD